MTSNFLTFESFSIEVLHLLRNEIHHNYLYTRNVVQRAQIDEEYQINCKYTDKQLLEAQLDEYFFSLKKLKDSYLLPKYLQKQQNESLRDTVNIEYEFIRNNKVLYYAYHVANREIEFMQPIHDQMQFLLRDDMLFDNRIEDIMHIEVNDNKMDDFQHETQMDLDINTGVNHENITTINTIHATINTTLNTLENNNNNNNDNIMVTDNKTDHDEQEIEMNMNITPLNIVENNNNIDKSIDMFFSTHSNDNTNINNENNLEHNNMLEDVGENKQNENTNDSNGNTLFNNSELNDKEQLEITNDINTMKQIGVSIKDSNQMLLNDVIKKTISSNDKLSVINNNASKVNTSLVVLNRKTKINFKKIKKLKKKLTNVEKTNDKTKRVFKKMKRKCRKQNSKNKSIGIRIQQNKLEDNVTITTNEEILSKFVEKISLMEVHEELSLDIQSKIEYNCIKKLQSKYRLFHEFYSKNWNSNGGKNIIKFKSNVTFSHCTFFLKSIHRNLIPIDNEIQLVYIKSISNGYELLETIQAKKYIIAQDYKNITILAYLDIIFDSKNVKLQRLLQKIRINQENIMNKYNNNNNNTDDNLSVFTSISSHSQQ